MNTGSTTLVSVKDNNRAITGLTNKIDIEQAIIQNNEDKYKQSFHTPLFNFPLVSLFGFKGLTPASQQVTAGTFKTDQDIDYHASLLLQELKTPPSVKDFLPINMELTFD
jgi:hypothetical protein